MDSALAWVGQIAAWVGQWIPRWIILDTTEGAVKFRGGKTPIECGPGVHFYWPARTKIQEYPTARQGERLQSQTMVTADGRTIVVGGMLVYSVTEILKLVATTFDPQGTVKDIALTAVHDVCCRMDWQTLQTEQQRSTLDTKLKNAAQKQLTDYGVKVEKLMLTDLAPCRVLRLSQAVSQEDAGSAHLAV